MVAESRRVLQDRYWLEDSWDEYGNSIYWQAFDSATQGEVFIQQLRPRTAPLRAARKNRESTAGKEAVGVPGNLVHQVVRLESPRSSYVLPVRDVFERKGSLWVVMDPVQPYSLHHLLDEQGRLERGDAAYLGVELAQALDELHTAGIAHGQVDPHNVFFRADRSLAVAGYGLKPAPGEDRGPWVRPWQPDSRYTAPELSPARATSPPVPTSSGDLWAMGMILHRILSGTGLLYGPLRKFRTVRKIHDARPPRMHREHEFNALMQMLLSPHSAARSSAAPALVTLRRIAEAHEPLAGGHWAVPNRKPRGVRDRLEAALIQLFTTVTSRVVTAFLTGVLVTYFGLHLAKQSSGSDTGTAVLSSLVFGLASGSVLVTVKVVWHCLALLPRGRSRGGVPGSASGAGLSGATGRAEGTVGAAGPDGPSPPASVSPPSASLPLPLGLPKCTPRLVLRNGPTRVGRPMLLEFALDVPEGHPYFRGPGDDREPAELMLVASARSAEATLMPPSASYRVHDTTAAPTAFTFTAHAPGRHGLRLTVYDRTHGLVLQELSATVVAAEPALLGSAPLRGPES
ncbi:protein kinase domain-containing protein [Streptomyces sp. SAI-129]|uniref:protein kinase domain-containing protein n=1 Tax=Streptomyces sp. SAI-129 TaxID=3377727 RepID=UPI003C79DF1B